MSLLAFAVVWSNVTLAGGSGTGIEAIEAIDSFTLPRSNSADVEVASRNSTAFFRFAITDAVLAADELELQLFVVKGKKPIEISVVEFGQEPSQPQTISNTIEVHNASRNSLVRANVTDFVSVVGSITFAVRSPSGSVKLAAAGTSHPPRIAWTTSRSSHLEIVSPHDQVTIEGGETIPVVVEASADITKVTVTVDGVAIGQAVGRPFSVDWRLDEVTPGAHVISAIGITDVSGSVIAGPITVTTSIEQSIETTTTSTFPPTTEPAPSGLGVELSEPSSGTRVEEAGVVRILAAVAGDVAGVAFYTGDTLLGSDGSAPFEFGWMVAAADSGTHVLSAVATDSAGDWTQSPTVEVVVDISGGSWAGDVVAVVETVPVRHGGDAADDVAIWVDSADPLNSVIVGTDKRGGLGVYGLDGAELHYYDDGRMNNVDLRQGFVLGGESVAIVAASDREGDAIHLYSVDPVTRGLVPIGPAPIETSIGLAGLCMYHSSVTGMFAVFVTDSSGTVQQWELSASGSNVTGVKVRTITLASTVEGCVADDAHGYLYLAEEDRGIWRYPAEPGSLEAAVLIDEVIDWGGSHLAQDVEGLAIFDAGGGSGYLIASSQGDDSFVVYDRRAPNGHVGTFGIAAGSIDGVTHTDGIDVTSADLGGPFDSGLFVAQDDDNGSGNQNFKLVPWSSIAALFGASETDSASDPVPRPDADLYVSSIRGDDANSGTTPGEPWKSLDKAARAVRPGQTIHLERGSRWSETLKLDIEATDTDRVRVLPYGSGAAPIIEDQSTCVRVSGSNITVEGLSIRNCSWSGITIEGDNNVVEGNRITGNAAGIYVKTGANRNTVRRNTLVDNNVMSVLTDGGSGDSGAFGILVHGDNTDIGYNTISGSNAFSYDYGWDGAAIEIYGGRDNYIHHNIASDNDTFIELGESRSRGNIVAYNVVTSSLDTSVFLVTRGAESSRGPVTGTIADNNSVYLTGVSSQGFVCHGGCTPDILTLRNNIIEARWKVGYADGSFNNDYNVFHGGKQQFEMGPHSIVADPLWVNPDAGDLRLQIDSPAIDLGTPLGYTTDINGATVPIDGDLDGHPAPDAGAYERGAS